MLASRSASRLPHDSVSWPGDSYCQGRDLFRTSRAVLRSATDGLKVRTPLTFVAMVLACGVSGACAAPVENAGEHAASAPDETLTAYQQRLLREEINWLPPDGRAQTARAKKIAGNYQGKSIVPYLKVIVEDVNEKLEIRIHAMYVMGETHDKQAIAPLKAIIDKPLESPVSREDWQFLHNAILCIGMVADDATLDLLFEMATEEYWIKRNPDSACARQEPAAFRSHMRLMALNGIANSGSQRAIDAFSKLDAVPEDLRGECEWLLKCAKKRNKERTSY